jgi:hypothetical protein
MFRDEPPSGIRRLGAARPFECASSVGKSSVAIGAKLDESVVDWSDRGIGRHFSMIYER